MINMDDIIKIVQISTKFIENYARFTYFIKWHYLS